MKTRPIPIKAIVKLLDPYYLICTNKQDNGGN